MSIMMVIIPLITVIFHLVSGAVAENPCTNSTIIDSLASKHCLTEFLKLECITNIDVQCGVVLDDIRPCFIRAIASDHSQTCTANEIHELILNFGDFFNTTYNFDVKKCLPLINCTDFESVMYYLQVSCEPQFESFVNSPTCGNLCHMATCHEDASNNSMKPCSVIDFQRTIRSSITRWMEETETNKTEICCGSASSGSYVSTFVAVHVLSMILFVVL